MPQRCSISDQIYRKEPKCYLQLQAMVTDVLKRPAATVSCGPETKKAGQSNLSSHSENEGDTHVAVAGSGHQKARAQKVQTVQSGTMTKTKVRR